MKYGIEVCGTRIDIQVGHPQLSIQPGLEQWKLSSLSKGIKRSTRHLSAPTLRQCHCDQNSVLKPCLRQCHACFVSFIQLISSKQNKVIKLPPNRTFSLRIFEGSTHCTVLFTLFPKRSSEKSQKVTRGNIRSLFVFSLPDVSKSTIT